MNEFTNVNKSHCWEAIRQKSLTVESLNLSNMCVRS